MMSPNYYITESLLYENSLTPTKNSKEFICFLLVAFFFFGYNEVPCVQ